MSGLFGSTLPEIAIVLMVVYFILSTICSAIQEAIADILSLRAADLERGIRNMLGDRNLMAIAMASLIKKVSLFLPRLVMQSPTITRRLEPESP